MIPNNVSKKCTQTLIKNSKIERDRVKLKAKKRKAFWPSSAATALFTSLFAAQSNDPFSQRVMVQDVTTNIGMSSIYLNNPKTTVNQYMEFLKEATYFSITLLTVLPFSISGTRALLNQDKIPNNNHHIDMSVFAGALFPLLVSEGIGYYLNKVEPKEKLSKKELNKQSKEVRKTIASGILASTIRSALLCWNIFRKPQISESKLEGNAVAISSLANVIKTIATVYLTHKNGERIRPSTSTSAVFFDGVISQSVANAIDLLFHKPLGLPNTKPCIIIESLIGGLISLRGIELISHNLDSTLNSTFGIKSPPKPETNDPKNLIK